MKSKEKVKRSVYDTDGYSTDTDFYVSTSSSLGLYGAIYFEIFHNSYFPESPNLMWIRLMNVVQWRTLHIQHVDRR